MMKALLFLLLFPGMAFARTHVIVKCNQKLPNINEKYIVAVKGTLKATHIRFDDYKVQGSLAVDFVNPELEDLTINVSGVFMESPYAALDLDQLVSEGSNDIPDFIKMSLTETYILTELIHNTGVKYTTNCENGIL